MKRSTHIGQHPASCPACITKAQAEKHPWEADYLAVMSRSDAKLADYKRKHDQAVARNVRNQAYRDCGMVKVRGALGGTYWE